MVATILKKVTSASRSNNSIPASNGGASTDDNTIGNDPAANVSSTAAVIDTISKFNSVKAVVPVVSDGGGEQELQSSWNWIFNQRGEGSNALGPRLGKLTAMGGYVTDIFSSVQETFYNASEETSKQIYSLSNNLTSKVSSTFNMTQQPHNQPITITESVVPTNNAVTKKPNFTPLSSSFSSRKWFMMDPYHTVTGRTHFLPTHHRDSVNAVRNLLQFVDVHGASDETNLFGKTNKQKLKCTKVKDPIVLIVKHLHIYLLTKNQPRTSMQL
jgi:hypothetical protein